MSEKIVKRTKLFKDSLYEKNKNILNIVYYLGNKIMLKEQLIILSEIIVVNNSKIKDKIEELKKHYNTDNNIRIYTLKDSYELQATVLEELLKEGEENE